MATGIYDNCYTCWNGCATNASDEGGRLISYRADTNGVRLASDTRVSDINVPIACGQIETGSKILARC
jgi:hypothetical protein